MIERTNAAAGKVNLYSPTSSGYYPYWDSVYLRFTVSVYYGSRYLESCVFINNEPTPWKTYTSTSVSDFITRDFLVGIHSLKVVAYFLGDDPVQKTTSFTITSATDENDYCDLRIDKVHSSGYDGYDMTICVIEDILGYNLETDDYTKFHPIIYKQTRSSLREIYYYDPNNYTDYDLDGLTNDHNIKDQVWDTIAAKNSETSLYSYITDLHGTCFMTSLLQVVPRARIVFIEVDGGIFELIAAYKWLCEDVDPSSGITYRFEDLGIDVLCTAQDHIGYNRIENWIELMSTDSDNPVIVVAPTGNSNQNYVSSPADLEYTIGVGGVQDSDPIQLFDSFLSIKNCWDYANPENFDYDIDGSHYIRDGMGPISLCTTNLPNGITYDGVRFFDDFDDGYIEAWYYGTASQYLAGALWLRNSDWDTSSTTNNFQDGYCARIYKDTFTIFKSVDGSLTSLVSTTLPILWHNRWWHIEFEAVGSQLKAWLTDYSGTYYKFIQVQDSTYDSGYCGFSARTNMLDPRVMYIDSIIVKNYDEIVDWDGEITARQVNWIRYESYNPGRSAGSNYGTGIDITSICYGTKLGWNPMHPDNAQRNTEFSGTSNACPIAAGIITLGLQVYRCYHPSQAKLKYYNVRGLLLSTGDPHGEAPATNDDSIIAPAYPLLAPDYWHSEYGYGIIDAYEFWLACKSL